MCGRTHAADEAICINFILPKINQGDRAVCWSKMQHVLWRCPTAWVIPHILETRWEMKAKICQFMVHDLLSARMASICERSQLNVSGCGGFLRCLQPTQHFQKPFFPRTLWPYVGPTSNAIWLRGWNASSAALYRVLSRATHWKYLHWIKIKCSTDHPIRPCRTVLKYDYFSISFGSMQKFCVRPRNAAKFAQRSQWNTKH